ncbi:unnamed protein product [Pelagomonas calceolata]|uniref:Uncharacterized protein n=1 Tax=Pelagomonas calceolata TaxID=35677 RepID=A0A8J2T0L2_9STRA|nr:unnamed protein product [Pelagomonas calceolata]
MGRFPCPAGCGRTFDHPPAAIQHGKSCGRPARAPPARVVILDRGPLPTTHVTRRIFELMRRVPVNERPAAYRAAITAAQCVADAARAVDEVPSNPTFAALCRGVAARRDADRAALEPPRKRPRSPSPEPVVECVAFQNDSDDEYREDDFEASPVPISAGPPTLGVHHTPGSYAHLLTRKTPPDWPHIGERPTTRAGRDAFKELRLDVVAAAWAAEKAREALGPDVVAMDIDPAPSARAENGSVSSPPPPPVVPTPPPETSSPNDGISALLSAVGDRGGDPFAASVPPV